MIFTKCCLFFLSFEKVHKIIKGSIADRDGRIRKGDRVLSINGKILKGATHKEALKIMKSPRPEVVIVISRNILKMGENGSESNGNSGLDSNDINLRLRNDDEFDILMGSNDNYQILKAALVKDGAGLGFILEGGRDSIYLERGRDLTLLDRGRDKPLAIKRIFKGWYCGIEKLPPSLSLFMCMMSMLMMNNSDDKHDSDTRSSNGRNKKSPDNREKK